MIDGNSIRIPFISYSSTAGTKEISGILDNLQRAPINNAPWAKFPYTPGVSFAIAWAHDSLILKYYVLEKEAIATYKNINDPVYKDSCVEFFISADGGYYNFEFNCEGVCLAGFGAGKTDRVAVSEHLIRKMKAHSFMQKSAHADDYWELCVQIPFEVLNANKASLLSEGRRMNFYKCGDDLPMPHFLCWNMIDTAEPDFHVPEFFGYGKFIPYAADLF